MPLCHPFAIAPKQRSEIVGIIALATANVMDRLAWADTPNGLSVYQQQMATQTVQMPFGYDLAYEVTFSVAKVDGTHERCLNIAVPLDLHKPFPAEAELIAQAFGFIGAIKDWRVFKVAHGGGQDSFTITMTQPVAAGHPMPAARPDGAKRDRAAGRGKALGRDGRSAKLA